MAADTVTGQEILFAMAEELGEIRTSFVNELGTSAEFYALGLSMGQNSTFLYGLGRIQGKGIRRVTGYTDAVQLVTLASAPSSAVDLGDPFEVCWWEPMKRSMAFAAINEAIRISWPYWYQEVVVNAASSSITLSANTHLVTLPTDCDGLIAIGIEGTNEPIRWIPPKNKETGQEYYKVEGQQGAYELRFFPRFSREGSINQAYAGLKLCKWYGTEEPLLVNETSTTQLPIEYFTSVACEIYRRRFIGTKLDGGDERTLPLLQELARQELQRLGFGKRPINALMDELTPKTEPEE